MHLTNKQSILSLVLALCCWSTGFVTAQKKQLPVYSKQLMQDDLVLLKKILEANHPSLYWHTNKEQIDHRFNTVYNSLPDSLTEIQYRNKIAYWLSDIRCGHTSVRYSRAFTRRLNNYRYPAFPLSIKVWGDSMVVLNNMHRKDSVLKRGTIVTGINGRKNKDIIDSIFQFISTDGFAINHKNQVLSNNFPEWYKSIFGLNNSYTVNYIDSLGQHATTHIVNFDPGAIKRDSTQKPTRTVAPPPHSDLSKRQRRLLSKRILFIDSTTKTAVMRLSTFSGGHLKRFFRKSFKTIHKTGISDLMIDLRDNGGGKVDNFVRLTKYLSDHRFKVGDSVVAKSRKFEYGRHIHPSWIYWIVMNIGGSKADDGSIHYRRYERHYFRPKEKNHFNGNLYLIQGGYSFSAATLFIATLKGQKNVTVVGEETGGGWYGNSAMHIPEVKLPNTKLRVRLPMYRLVMDSTRIKGRGIQPDWQINPSSYAIKNGIDLKISLIQAEILRKRQVL